MTHRLIAGAWLAAASTTTVFGAELPRPGANATAAAPTLVECHARVNDTPSRLLECIQAPDLWRHLSHLQDIADAHPGPKGHPNRDTGSSGYRASVDYVAGLVSQAGYDVHIQSYDYERAEIVGTPRFGIGGRPFASGTQWAVARHSPGGHVAARLQAASATGTGCDASELSGFAAGRVAVLERGDCTLDVQVRNATAAGAAAIVLVDGAGADPAPLSAIEAPLRDVPDVPVIGFVTPAAGAALLRSAHAADAPVAHIDIESRTVAGTDYNLIADSPHGDPSQVVVVDAHLDAIYGAGILDNGSGSITILDIALMLAQTPTRNRLRFIWFGGEELGLLGSKYYTTHLDAAERDALAFDVDVDVTATPNYDYLIADPADASNRAKFPPNVVPQSRVGTEAFKEAFDLLHEPVRSARFGNGGTDSNAFSRIGIPNTGILTNQDCCKQPWEVAIWGGVRGDYEGVIPGFDQGCVDKRHRWCDDLSNNDPKVFTIASRASAFVVLKMAEHDFKPSN